MVKFAVIQGNRPRGSVGERTPCRSAESGTARSPFPNRTRRLKLSPCLEPCADSDIPSRALLYILMVGVQHVYHYVVTQTKSLFLFFKPYSCIWWNSLSSRDVHQNKKTRE